MSRCAGRVPLTRPDPCTRTKLPVKLSLQPSSWPDLKDKTLWIEIHEHSDSRKQTPNLSPQRKQYNFGRILFIPSQKEMNGPTSRWIHRESSTPISTCPFLWQKESPKFLPQPWVRAAHLTAWSIQEHLTSVIIFHSVVKPFPSPQLESSDSLLLLRQPFKPETPGRPSGARHL